MVQISFNRLNMIQQNEFISTAIDLAGVGVVITDPSQFDNPIIYVNRGFEELTGYNRTDIIGLNCRFLQGDQRDVAANRKISHAVKQNRTLQVPLKNYKKDGTLFWNDLNIFPVYIQELDQSFFIGIQRDITKQVEAEERSKLQLLKIRRLSTPIIPVHQNISILPLIGEMDEDRQQQLLEEVGAYAEYQHKDYIILDLSGIHAFSERIFGMIQSLRKLLKLMGSSLIITGITPELALANTTGYESISSMRTFNTVESALNYLNSKVK